MPESSQHDMTKKPFKPGEPDANKQNVQKQTYSSDPSSIHTKNPPSETSIQFLLAEYNGLNNLLKHTDERLTATINLFLTMTAVVISGTVFLAQNNSNAELLISLLIPVSLLLSITGSFMSYQLVRARILKAEYLYALNLIRTFFVDLDHSIYPYLFLPTEKMELHSSMDKIFKRKQGFRGYLNFINLCTGILMGFPVAAGIWIFYSASPMWLLLFLGGLSSALSIFWLDKRSQDLSQKLKAELENRRKQIREF